MSKTLCEICDNDKFENINGFYYCTVCNTQSKNVRDIELHEDEDVKHTGQKEITQGSKSKKKIKEEPSTEFNIDANFSTYHVFNYLLCAQANDLIRLGVDRQVKSVIFNLWRKYLQKIGIAFFADANSKPNEKNIKWERDKKYFSYLKLISESEDNIKQEVKIEVKEEPVLPDDIDYSRKNDLIQNELSSEDDDLDCDNDDDDDEENTVDTLSTEEATVSVTKSQIVKFVLFIVKIRKRNTILFEVFLVLLKLLNRFEWIRMPHTIALLNLSLILIRSNLLITDLIRFIKNGQISYFNIDSVLPQTMNFSYGEDATMFNAYTTPSTDYLRYLTGKLGQFLELQQVKLIPIKDITSRFLIDLNMPNQLHVLVNSLIDKIKPIDEIDFSKAEYENLEATALTYIYVVITIIYQYDANLTRLDANDLEDSEYFNLNEWITNMQNRLHDFKIKHKADLRDLSSFKPTIMKHRFNMNTYPYISQYRRNEIKRALRAPLDDDNEEKLNIKKELLEEQNEKQQFKNLSSNLAYINDYKSNPIDFRSKLLSSLLLTDEKLKLITDKHYRSANFKLFAKDNLQSYELKAKYLIGLEVNSFDWLLEMFQYIAQSSSYVKMFRYIDNLLNRLNTKKA